MSRGFTLLELLVVVSIIAVLSTFAYISFRGTQAGSRDAKRQVELKQYQILLETYGLRNNNIYPITGGRLPTMCATLSSTATCPTAPNYASTGNDYMYQSNATGTSYVIWAALEKEPRIFVTCTNGQTGKINFVANYAGNGGNCPI